MKVKTNSFLPKISMYMVAQKNNGELLRRYFEIQ